MNIHTPISAGPDYNLLIIIDFNPKSEIQYRMSALKTSNLGYMQDIVCIWLIPYIIPKIGPTNMPFVTAQLFNPLD